MKVIDENEPSPVTPRRRGSTMSRRRLSSVCGSLRERRRSSCASGMDDEPIQRFSWRGIVGELTYREFLSVSSKSPKSHSECNADGRRFFSRFFFV